MPETTDEPMRRNELANTWTLRGISLLNESTADNLREAIRCFDTAIELRRGLPLAENPWFRYGYIAGWMNRGDALTRLGSPAELEVALKSYDEALTQSRELPLEMSPLFRRRLAIAWLNRGITLQAQGTFTSVRAAAESFEQAQATLSDSHDAEDQKILGSAWMNCGNALLQVDAPREARAAHDCARRALDRLTIREMEDPVTAEASFKARHVLCRAIAHQLADAATPRSEYGALLDEATDAVDAGLDLGRHWEVQGVASFRALRNDLFRFGCRAYQAHQPHFLVEFLLENLDPNHGGCVGVNRELHAAAVEAIWRELGRIQREGFRAIHTPEFERLIEQLRTLRVAEERLAALRYRWDPDTDRA